MPRLNSNAIPPNTSQGRTFASNVAQRPVGNHPAPQPSTGIGAGVVIVLALFALVLVGGLLGSLRHTVSRAIVSQPSTQRPAEPETYRVTPAPTIPYGIQPQTRQEMFLAAPPVTQSIQPTVFHPPAVENFHVIPTLPETLRSAIIVEPKRAAPALDLRLMNMRNHRHLLQLPNGHVMRTFDVGRLCEDLISSKAHASNVPAAHPSDGQPRLEVKIVKCETFQTRGTDLFTAKVTLHARWLDAAGNERNQCFVNGHCHELVPYNEAIGRASKSAVDGVMNLLQR